MYPIIAGNLVQSIHANGCLRIDIQDFNKKLLIFLQGWFGRKLTRPFAFHVDVCNRLQDSILINLGELLKGIQYGLRIAAILIASVAIELCHLPCSGVTCDFPVYCVNDLGPIASAIRYLQESNSW